MARVASMAGRKRDTRGFDGSGLRTGSLYWSKIPWKGEREFACDEDDTHIHDDHWPLLCAGTGFAVYTDGLVACDCGDAHQSL
jgi:hypothetical protein